MVFLSHKHHFTLPAFSCPVKASTLHFSASLGSPRAHIPNIANNVFPTTTQSANNVNATKSVRFDQRPYSVFKDIETVREYKSGRLFTSCIAAAGGHKSDAQEELAHGLVNDLDEDSVVRSFALPAILVASRLVQGWADACQGQCKFTQMRGRAVGCVRELKRDASGRNLSMTYV
jgi:hypothetical protein